MEPLDPPVPQDLISAVAAGDRTLLRKIISRNQKDDPKWQPPYSSLIRLSVHEDQAPILNFILSQAPQQVPPNIMEDVFRHQCPSTFPVLLSHLEKTPDSFDIDYYIPWFNSVLANAVMDDKVELVTLLLDHGSDPNRHLVDEQFTILATAAEDTSLQMVKLLVDHGAHVAGSGAIVMAAESGFLDVVLYLLEKGADINQMGVEDPQPPLDWVGCFDNVGTPVQRAVAGGKAGEEMVRVLVAKGADLKMRDRRGRSVMELARKEGNVRMMELLRELGAEDEREQGPIVELNARDLGGRGGAKSSTTQNCSIQCCSTTITTAQTILEPLLY